LMSRGVAVELRSRGNAVWATFWDALFFLSSGLLAVFLGAAIANVVRGVPLDANGFFFEPLWTDFNPKSSTPGILDWYTLLIGLVWWSIGMVLAAVYFVLIYRLFWGKVRFGEGHY